MAHIADLIATYLTACDVEGKSPLTLASYAASLRDLRRIGAREGFPDIVWMVRAGSQVCPGEVLRRPGPDQDLPSPATAGLKEEADWVALGLDWPNNWRVP